MRISTSVARAGAERRGRAPAAHAATRAGTNWRVGRDHGHEVIAEIQSRISETASGSTSAVPSGGMPGRDETF